MPFELSAEILLDASDHGRTFINGEYEPLQDLARAEALQTGIAVARIARGERPVGYKIGFTNRSIWPLYGVFHPIWGPLWNTSVRQVDADDAIVEVDIGRFTLPRIEPEIVVGLHSTPRPGSAREMLEAVEWVAHGYEIVQSPYPDWRFRAAEAFAAQGLHGALVVGPRRPVALLGADPDAALDQLAELELELRCNDTPVAHGRGRDVLDGPLHALAHLVHEMALRGHSIEAGAIVTTGTLTDAQPLEVGQRWTSRIRDLELPTVTIGVVDERHTTSPRVLG